MNYEHYDFVSVRVEDRIASLTFNRPEKMNACRREDHAEFGAVLRDVARDDDVDVTVVAGQGKAFSVGADYEFMEQLATDPEARIELQREARELVHAHLDLDKPIIAALNGFASGAGLVFALLCDFILVEEQVNFADGHIRSAIAAGDGGVLTWPLSAGLVKAKRYLLTGDSISAHEAERIGLVTEVVGEGTGYERAMELARRLTRNSQAPMRYTKHAINNWVRQSAGPSFDLALALETQTFGDNSERVRQAVHAIRDKTAELH